MLKLRDYQENAVDAVMKDMKYDGHSLVILPTGAGKSLVIAEIANRLNENILILGPSKEIIEQNSNKMRQYVSGHEIGIYSASMNSRNIRKYTFATIQSIYRKPEIFKHFEIVLLDECFVAGTKIGDKNIEDIQAGDFVESFNHKTNQVEIKEVEAVSKRKVSSKLLCLDLTGQVMIVTENHPIYVVGKGYIKAKDVQKGDEVYEKIVGKESLSKSDSIDLLGMSERNSDDYAVSAMEIQKNGRSVSPKYLRKESSASKNRYYECEELRERFECGNSSEDFRQNESNRTQTEDARRQRNRINGNTESFNESAFVGLAGGTSRKDFQDGERGVSASLQNRFSESDFPSGGRDRRQFSYDSQTERSGQEENSTLRIVRVESVEVLKQGSSGKFSNGGEYDYVYNLQVKDNNNYFANNILVHNCDLFNPKNSDGMFTQFFEAIGAKKVFGFTATPYRNMQAYHKNKQTGGFESALTLKLINRIKPDFWKKIIYNINNQVLFSQGYLCPLKYFDRSHFDHSQIPMNKSRSDFDTDRFAQSLATYRPGIIDLIHRAANKRKSVLVFCNSVGEAHDLARQTPNSAAVDGKTHKDTRDRIIREFREGRIKVVFNMNCLTVGFDHPELDTIFMLRPTRSLRLYYQMLGRGIRIAPGKTECVVVDFTSNVKNLGRIETIRLVKEQRLLDRYPMWQLVSEAADDWHGKQLYSIELKAKPKIKEMEYQQMEKDI